MNPLSKILRQWATTTGRQQKDVIAATGFGQARVNNYFRGIAEPPFEFYEKFKEAFDVDLRLLVQEHKEDPNRKKSSSKPFPVFDLELKPATTADFLDQTDLIIYYMDAPLFNDATAAVKVTGSAMMPAFNPGDIIPVKKVTNLNTIPLGEPYIVVTEEQKLIRYVKANDKRREETFLLRSEDSNLDDIIINRKDIVALYQIIGKISRR